MILGIDVSMYDEQVDWTLLKRMDVRFAIIRAGQGAYIQDELFENHVRGCEAAGIPWAAYFWVDPNQNVSMQVTNCRQILSSKMPHFVAADIEQNWSWTDAPSPTPALISSVGKAFCDQTAALGIKTVVYTRTSFINEFARPMLEWIGNYPLWIANYPYLSGRIVCSWETFYTQYAPKQATPILPGINNPKWVLWQFSGDKFILPGCSAALDLNWFNETEDFGLWFGGENVSEPEVEPSGVVFVVKARAGVNVRSAPRLGWNVMRSILSGGELKVESIVDGQLGRWAKLTRAEEYVYIGPALNIEPKTAR